MSKAGGFGAVNQGVKDYGLINAANSFNATLQHIVNGDYGPNVFDPSFFTQAQGYQNNGLNVNQQNLTQAQSINTTISGACADGSCNQVQANKIFASLFPDKSMSSVTTDTSQVTMDNVKPQTNVVLTQTTSFLQKYGLYIAIGAGVLLLFGLSKR